MHTILPAKLLRSSFLQDLVSVISSDLLFRFKSSRPKPGNKWSAPLAALHLKVASPAVLEETVHNLPLPTSLSSPLQLIRWQLPCFTAPPGRAVCICQSTVVNGHHLAVLAKVSVGPLTPINWKESSLAALGPLWVRSMPGWLFPPQEASRIQLA